MPSDDRLDPTTETGMRVVADLGELIADVTERLATEEAKAREAS